MNRSISSIIIGIAVFLIMYGLSKIQSYVSVQSNIIVVILLLSFVCTVSYFIDKGLSDTRQKGKKKKNDGGKTFEISNH